MSKRRKRRRPQRDLYYASLNAEAIGIIRGHLKTVLGITPTFVDDGVLYACLRAKQADDAGLPLGLKV
jgi:hypothetical protein